MALVTRHIASMDRLSGRLDDATSGTSRRWPCSERTGDQVAAAYVLQSLAQVKLERTSTTRRRNCCRTRCGWARPRNAAGSRRRCSTGSVRPTCWPATWPAPSRRSSWRWRGSATSAILIGEAYVLQGVGVAKVRQGEFDAGRSALQRSLELAGTVGERLVEARALLGLSELALARGDPGEAVDLGQQASEVFLDVGAVLYQVRTLTLLSAAHAALGDLAAARVASADAAELSRKLAGDSQVS